MDNLKAQKATGVSVEEFYAMQDKALAEKSVGKQANLFRYSMVVLARVEPMPTFDQFRSMLDEDIETLVKECKAMNPRHFPEEKPAEPVPGEEKKSES